MAEQTLNRLPDAAIDEILSVLNPETSKASVPKTMTEALYIAMSRVTKEYGFKPQQPSAVDNRLSPLQQLETLARHNHCRIRQVQLIGEWWLTDNGPLLAFIGKDQKPCALIPTKHGGYVIFDPIRNKTYRLTPRHQKLFNDTAYFLYPSFQQTGKRLKLREVLRFAFKTHGIDVGRIVVLQILISSLGLIVPIVTGLILDGSVPNSDMSLHWQLILVLIVNTCVITLFSIAQVVGMMRFKFKLNTKMQAAIWDRLLRMPVNFFRRFTAGDLANRASGFDQIQQFLTGAVISTMVAGLLSVITFALLFYYSPILAVATVGMVLILSIVNILATLRQLKYQRKLYYVAGRLSGYLFQVLSNISKLRVANREANAFTRWSQRFSKQNRLSLKAGKVVVGLNTFEAMYMIIITVLLFVLVKWLGDDISFGSFIAFNAAFAQFFAATMAMTTTFADIIDIVPLYERTKPILEALPEDEKRGIDPGKLKGAIELNNIHFRYHTDSTPVLKDISFSIKAGEFIAIVGPSGAGKSSLMRLLLGFEVPESGRILYDNQELTSLDKYSVRRQIGVVLQNSRLIPGSVIDNIVGSTQLSQQTAWDAARLAAVDQEISAMPMGMQTIITEGGKTLSAGQRQRILIARALVHQPSLLLLDEATSALDNATQGQIMQHLSKLDITRIIIAQRLITITNADRIYVLDKGEIVQTGSYQDLIQQAGLFADLAKRQQ